MANVTFVLGAGASAQALPVVGKIKENLSQLNRQIEDRLWKLASEMSRGLAYPEEYTIPPKGSYAAPFFAAIDQLRVIAASHPSLDTYARKLSLRQGSGDDEELIRFEAALSCYFVLLQTLNGLDQRYDHFFASILEPGRGLPVLPKGLDILTWNYDTQLEKSFRGFTTSIEHLYNEISNSQRIIRLNGVCATPTMGEHIGEYLGIALDSFTFDTLGKLNEMYLHMTGKLEPWIPPQISFAWDSTNYERLHSPLQNICTSTNVAVFIGYSFPYFNKETDDLIVAEMLSSRGLKKMYIQAEKKDLIGIKERLEAMLRDKPVPVQLIEGCDLFYLPDELSR
jgi:hypothetical protein